MRKVDCQRAAAGQRARADDARDSPVEIFLGNALFDRERFGPVSRDRCVTAVRERFGLAHSAATVALS